MPGWGSWEWVGQDVQAALARWYRTSTFEWNEIPVCDVLCVIKHPLPVHIGRCIPATTQIVFAPVDHYGSTAEIDADGAWLRRCSRIVVHCERLRRYISHYAPVEYLDHHVKYVSPATIELRSEGPILWVGVRSNLAPLNDWLRNNPLPRDLVVLTNPEETTTPLTPGMFGLPPVTSRWN